MNNEAAVRILIVDDDDEMAEAIFVRLSAAGYECVTAGNGEDGYAQFDEGGIDLVITDVIMPMSDGFSMVEWIRQISDVPVIVITGYDECRQPFATDFPEIKCIGKPYHSDELLSLVATELARAEAGGYHTKAAG
jgi:DNA-binding response OmpR family regulator